MAGSGPSSSLLKRTLFFCGRVGVPVTLVYGTVRLGVWGPASDTRPVTDFARQSLPDVGAVVDRLPALGDYGLAVKRTWNAVISSSVGSIAKIPDLFGSAKDSLFGKKD